MKEFVKMTLATMAGLLVFGIVVLFFSFAMIGAVASMGDKQPVMPREAVLKIDMSTFTLSEQSTEANPLDALMNGGQTVPPVTPSGFMYMNLTAGSVAAALIALTAL